MRCLQRTPCSFAKRPAAPTPTCKSSRTAARAARPASASSPASAGSRACSPPAPSTASSAPPAASRRRSSRWPRTAAARGRPGPRVGASAPAWCLTGSGGPPRCHEVLRAALSGRRFRFDVERAVFLTVSPTASSTPNPARTGTPGAGNGTTGSRASARFRSTTSIGRWRGLGEALPSAPAGEASPRCVKDLLEEQLFARRRTLFSRDALVFFDTTSVFFTGEGGEQLGARGFSKDHRPECKQLVLGMVLDRDGRPVVLGGVAGQHERCEHPGAGGAAARGALRDAPGVRGGGRGDDQPPGASEAGGDGLGIHPGRRVAADRGSQGPGSGRPGAVPGGRVDAPGEEAERGGEGARAEAGGQGGCW